MTLEHYPGMTEKALAAIEQEAHRRWDLTGVLILHRVGPLQPNDRIVLVAAASPHRREAVQACEYLIDTLKTSAPFWKKELTPAGARWVSTNNP
jgi:molybdopterin synthase catalytic subunit